MQAQANYGTNGDSDFTRSATIPARSDTILVSSSFYNGRGENNQSLDPAGSLTCLTFDDAGQKTQQILNCTTSSSSSSSSSASSNSSGSSGGSSTSDDKNVTTLWAYTPDHQIKTTTAVNAETGNQVTTNLYGTTLVGSDVARNDVQSGVVYPDGGQISYLVNRQSENKQFTDQRGVVHAYARDLLGRKLFDSVLSFISSSSSSSSSNSGISVTEVDSTVQRIGWTYEVRGLVQSVTSYSSAIIGQGTVVNDVQRVFNSFEQPIAEYQEHNGAVNLPSSVNVQYQYADGSSNTIRPTALVYPNGRVLNYDYGISGGIDDTLSRIASLIDNDGVTHLADYTRVGANTFVQQNSPEPRIAWSMINGSGTDPYIGFDQFNRVVDNRWYSTATSVDLDRIQHGYDRAGNRLYRKNTVAEAAGVYLDELYGYDGVNRLAELQRGQLNTSNDEIVAGTLNFGQAWSLDATGNWMQFWQNGIGASWDLRQTRTANPGNEITDITGGGWAQPAYDSAGNMTEMPEATDPSSANTNTFDAWNRIMSTTGGASLVQRNAYDGENRRVTKLDTGALRHNYFSIAWQSLEERLGTSMSPDRQFVWGRRYIDGLLLRDRGSERLYALQDPNCNVTAILDSTGAVAERYMYAAYGQPAFLTSAFAILSESLYTWETLFCGYRFESNSGMYQNRERPLLPVVGVWPSREPLRLSTNSYEYCASRPLTYADPSGLAPVHIIWPQDPGIMVPTCLPEEDACVTRAKRHAIQLLLTNAHCFPRLFAGRNNRDCNSPILTQCVLQNLLTTQYTCGLAGVDCSAEGAARTKYSRCATIKTEAATGIVSDGVAHPFSCCRPCKHWAPNANDCRSCVYDLATPPSVVICRYDQFPSIANYCQDDVSLQSLAAVLVHEAAHSCVGQHHANIVSDNRINDWDRCGRPDANHIGNSFFDCAKGEIKIPPRFPFR